MSMCVWCMRVYGRGFVYFLDALHTHMYEFIMHDSVVVQYSFGAVYPINLFVLSL